MPSWVTAASTASLMAMPRLPGAVGVRFEDRAAALGVGRRAGRDFAAPDVHHHSPVGLLMVAHLDHEDLALDVEHLAGEGERGAPLAGAGLGGQPVDALHFVIVSLGDGRIRFVGYRGGCGFHL